MSFNSLEFLFFLPVFLVVFYAGCFKARLRDSILLVSSYIFYMFWYWQYAGLIALSTLVDYYIGGKLSKEKNPLRRKLIVSASLVLNLGMLGVFKYFNFFYESSQEALMFFGVEIPDFYHQLLLPVGISFYTFQTLSYTLDIYRNKIKPEKSLTKFAVFVSFFPQLVAGPIVKAKDFLPQINRPTVISKEAWDCGIMLIFIGLFKKIVIADLLAYLAVDSIFANPGDYSSVDLLIGLYAYSFQIYCDFSGYSDIAIGLALLMGFTLPINFDRPYLSQTPSDFWMRWHISLSSWLKEYLYFSLGGNRLGSLITCRNLVITMLLGGLWHGASFNFILWGGFHGLILVLTRGVVAENSLNIKAVLKMFLNFHLIVFSWLLFRVSEIEIFFSYLSGLSLLTGGTSLHPLLYSILGFAILMHIIPRRIINNTMILKFNNFPLPLKATVFAGLLGIYVGASVGTPTFIYFQF